MGHSSNEGESIYLMPHAINFLWRKRTVAERLSQDEIASFGEAALRRFMAITVLSKLEKGQDPWIELLDKAEPGEARKNARTFA